MNTSSPQQSATSNQISDMQVQHTECTSFSNHQEGDEFDRNFFKTNPKCQALLRPCSQMELPKGIRESPGGLSMLLFKKVLQEPPLSLFALTPESVGKYNAIAQLIKNATRTLTMYKNPDINMDETFMKESNPNNISFLMIAWVQKTKTKNGSCQMPAQLMAP